jgi:hypothetical protein
LNSRSVTCRKLRKDIDGLCPFILCTYLEHLKSLPYEAVEGGLQGGVCNPSGFGYTIAIQSIGTDLGDGSGEEGMTMITVTVDWDGDNSYAISGVVSRW